MADFSTHTIHPDWPIAVNFAAHDEMEYHTHHFSELALVIRGKGIHRFLDDERELSRGHVLFIPPGVSHGYLRGENLAVCNLLFHEGKIPLFPGDLADIEGFHALFRADGEIRQRVVRSEGIRLDSQTMTQLEDLLEELHRELHHSHSGWQMGTLSLFYRFFVTLCRKISEENSSPSLLQGGEILAYLDRNYQNDLTLELLSDHFAMSVSTFQRFFRKNFGTSPSLYLRELRLKKAAELINSAESPLSEIAQNCGFYDSSHFGRLFRQYWGVTPRQYGKEKKKLC